MNTELADNVVTGWAIDFALGFGPGLALSTIFFAGLALGIRAARTSGRPTALLIVSAVTRIALLIGVALEVIVTGIEAQIAPITRRRYGCNAELRSDVLSK